jgi:hypothetical protein
LAKFHSKSYLGSLGSVTTDRFISIISRNQDKHATLSVSDILVDYNVVKYIKGVYFARTVIEFLPLSFSFIFSTHTHTHPHTHTHKVYLSALLFESDFWGRIQKTFYDNLTNIILVGVPKLQ